MKLTFKGQGTKQKDIVNKSFIQFNWLYSAIVIMISIGVGILISSYWIKDNDLKNISVGLGTGVVTSALVSLIITIDEKRGYLVKRQTGS